MKLSHNLQCWKLSNLILAEPDEIEFRLTTKDSTLYDIFIGEKDIEVEFAWVCMCVHEFQPISDSIGNCCSDVVIEKLNQ